jgi:6-phospho-3-hexuloisomerase
MSDTFLSMGQQALDDLAGVLKSVNDHDIEHFIAIIVGAKRIALHGLGREGLQMQGLAMRLFHMGLDAHVVGSMTTPHVGKGDLLIVSAGPGDFATIQSLVSIAKAAGVGTAVVTAQSASALARNADVVLHIPAQTMANDQTGAGSILPMGSLYEVSMMLSFELIVLKLRQRLGETPKTMRMRHTNLE